MSVVIYTVYPCLFQAITLLNNAGVCVSYQRAWEYLRLLTNEAEYLRVVRTGHWQWVYDNVNVHQKVRHERAGIYTCTIRKNTYHYRLCIHVLVCSLTDKHSTMLNMTARLAVEIRNLPDWEIDWDDTTPQRDPATLTISDLLPGEADGTELQKRAMCYIMHILVEEFPSLADLQPFLPSSDTPAMGACTSNVVPMKILFKDEKYRSETTEILTKLVEDANLSGKPEVCIHVYTCSAHIIGAPPIQIHVHVYKHVHVLQTLYLYSMVYTKHVGHSWRPTNMQDHQVSQKVERIRHHPDR